MSCDIYHVSEHTKIQFGYMDDFPCLCTFPTNNEAMDNKIDPYHVASLAMLGAAVVLAHRDNAPEYFYIPQDLPEWIIDQIKKSIRLEDE